MQRGHRLMASQGRLPWIVVGGVVVAIAAATWLIRDRGAATAEAPAEPVQPVATGTAPPATRSGAPASRPLPTDPAERMAAISERRAERRAEFERRNEEMRVAAEKTFTTEQVDASWAPVKERELDTIAARPEFATANATPKRMDVQCKSSVCRLDGDFTSMGQAEDWVLMYMSSVGSAMPNSVVTRTANPDGSASVRIYGRAR